MLQARRAQRGQAGGAPRQPGGAEAPQNRGFQPSEARCRPGRGLTCSGRVGRGEKQRAKFTVFARTSELCSMSAGKSTLERTGRRLSLRFWNLLCLGGQGHGLDELYNAPKGQGANPGVWGIPRGVSGFVRTER